MTTHPASTPPPQNHRPLLTPLAAAQLEVNRAQTEFDRVFATTPYPERALAAAGMLLACVENWADTKRDGLEADRTSTTLNEQETR